MADGRDFVAVDEISNKAGVVVAAVGQTCENVDSRSLGWLEQHGHIRRVAGAIEEATTDG